MQMGVNLLRHLLRLPMNYFESRHVGDIVSRFGSLAQIRERITTGFVETLVDGVMAITVLVMMALYSLKLTAVVLGAIALYTLVRLASSNRFCHSDKSIAPKSSCPISSCVNPSQLCSIGLFNRGCACSIIILAKIELIAGEIT